MNTTIAARLRILLTSIFLSLICYLLLSTPSYSEPISIQEFSAPADSFGTPVAEHLPIYKLHIQGGKLLDDNGGVFESYQSQTTVPSSSSECTIHFSWIKRWKAYYTTFYVVLANDPSHILAVRACGKSPLKMNSTLQYDDIAESNLINHAQIAGKNNGTINKVIAAGEMDVVDGHIVYMDTCSGHFRPTAGSLLGYLKERGGGALPLTSDLKNIVSSGSISDEQIQNHLTRMVEGDQPKRTVRVGTKDCTSYTTVFEATTSGDQTFLSGGLLTYGVDKVRVFQNSLSEATNRNIHSIDLRAGSDIFNYAVYVDTEWHIHNNSIKFDFTDESNDTYSLTVLIYSWNHTVSYNSDKPNINKISFRIY